MRTGKQKIIEVTWFMVVVLLFVLSIFFTQNGVLQDRLSSFGIWAPLILIVLKISTLVIAPLGGAPLYILSGALFGGWKGFLLCFLGDVLGSAASFLIGRYYGKKVVRFFIGEALFERVNKFTDLLANTKSFIKARLATITIPEILAYAAGLSPINFWKFLALHMPLYAVTDAILVFLGAQIMNLTVRYSFAAFGLLAIVSGISIFLFYKDYQKTEGM